MPKHVQPDISSIEISYQRLQAEAIARTPPCPAASGRGVVICAGRPRYFTGAYVAIRMLRDVVGSKLPVEVWHAGASEISIEMATLLINLGNVEVIDATTIQTYSSHLRGWALKPFAILHTRFRDVLYLDADNIPIHDPARLFETPQYAATGALFWPDIHQLPPESPIWNICGIPYQRESAFESGQIVVDRQRCWEALWLTMHFNEHRDFYYQILHGDKDTFHMAWRMLNRPYSMVPHPVRLLGPCRRRSWPDYFGPVLAQKDFDGEVLFQHRNQPKWVLFGDNPRYRDFRYEDECLGFLQELAERWDGRLEVPVARGANCDGLFRLVCVSDGERVVELLPDGRIRDGGFSCLRWSRTMFENTPAIEIFGDGYLTCRLLLQADGVWRGPWLCHERFPAELHPVRCG